ncbi:MAG TPA: hypothetical protein PLR86_06580 [Planctomycetota bacterium]|nr:hypothetical protein [Planctomycetota bacterium]
MRKCMKANLLWGKFALGNLLWGGKLLWKVTPRSYFEGGKFALGNLLWEWLYYFGDTVSYSWEAISGGKDVLKRKL